MLRILKEVNDIYSCGKGKKHPTAFSPQTQAVVFIPGPSQKNGGAFSSLLPGTTNMFRTSTWGLGTLALCPLLSKNEFTFLFHFLICK